MKLEDIEMNLAGFYLPKTEKELIFLVKHCYKNGYQLRVRGSAHSVDKAIYTDHYQEDEPVPNEINILLDYYNKITKVDKKNKIVTAQAGIRLGVDPFSLTGNTAITESLLYQIDQMGWATDDLGGITHQSLAGFISTGSAGGSVKHGIHKNIVGLRIIDGTGKVHEFSLQKDKEKLNAAVVSMGLLGVVSTVTLKLTDRYDIIGQEAISKVEDCEIDLFGDGKAGKPSLEEFLRKTEYTRLMWWPQKGVQKMVVWQARRMKQKDYTPKTNPPYGYGNSDFEPKVYEEVGDFPTIALWFAGLFYTIIGNLNKLGFIGKLINKGMGKILPFVLNMFVQSDCDKPEPQKCKPQEFWDTWWHGLPMDNQMNDELLPTEFTEIWIDLKKAKEVMNALKDHYDKNGLSATGTYACEIYAAKANSFWMSPAYKRDVIRIDLFWFARNDRNPVRSFYPQFWKLLKPYAFRLHWGKFLAPGKSETGAAYLREQYPKWDAFLKLREEMDPKNIFLTAYWKEHLGIDSES